MSYIGVVVAAGSGWLDGGNVTVCLLVLVVRIIFTEPGRRKKKRQGLGAKQVRVWTTFTNRGITSFSCSPQHQNLAIVPLRERETIAQKDLGFFLAY